MQGQDESTGPGAAAVAPDSITLLLDGASGEDNVLTSACIPVGWFMNDEVLAKHPIFLLIVEQNQEEIEANDSNNRGRRYVRTPAEALLHLQMSRPGGHRIIVLAFGINDPADRKNVRFAIRELMAKRGSGYNRPISAGYAEQGRLTEVCNFDAHLIAAKVAYCTIPDDEKLFAKKPEDRLGKLWWWYANLWHKGDPRDECEFKERSLIALPKLAPASIVGLFWAFLFAVCSIIGTLYALTIPPILLFIGYRPVPYWRNVIAALQVDGLKDLRRFPKDGYRVWSMHHGTCHDFPRRRMLFTPLELVLLLLPPVVFIIHWLRPFFHPLAGPEAAPFSASLSLGLWFVVWATATTAAIVSLISLMVKRGIFRSILVFLRPIFHPISRLLHWTSEHSRPITRQFSFWLNQTLNSYLNSDAQVERRREREHARARAAEQSMRAKRLLEQLAATKKSDKEHLAREKAEQLKQDRLLAAQKKEAEDRQWLMDHLHVSLAPTSGQLDFKTIWHHPARTKVMLFKAAFYEAKRLVCRPYAR